MSVPNSRLSRSNWIICSNRRRHSAKSKTTCFTLQEIVSLIVKEYLHEGKTSCFTFKEIIPYSGNHGWAVAEKTFSRVIDAASFFDS